MSSRLPSSSLLSLFWLLLLLLIVLLLSLTIDAFTLNHNNINNNKDNTNINNINNNSSNKDYKLLETIPHDEKCFTQGIEYHNNNNDNELYLFESCGLYKKSEIRKIRVANGEIVSRYKFKKDIFAEGLTVINNVVYVLTWKNKKVFVFSKESLGYLGTHSLVTSTGEGWGLTHSDTSLIVSDGSNKIDFFAIPSSDTYDSKEQERKRFGPWKLERRIAVVDESGKDLQHINELEYSQGYIYANVWYRDIIVKIDPAAGNVVKTFHLESLYPQSNRPQFADCLNGIAVRKEDDQFLVTGKQWPVSFVLSFNTDFYGSKQDSRPEFR